MAKKWLLFVVIMLIALPVWYVARFTPNEKRFNRIVVGDNEQQVVSLMGKPFHIEKRAPFFGDVDYEYDYQLWPFPDIYSVGFKNNRVVKKYLFQSP